MTTRLDEIHRRAYEFYLQRGGHPGSDLEDWLRAEREANKTLVLEAFDTLFNQRDYAKAESYWCPNYIQHSAHIQPGREGLFNLVKSIPPTLKHEPGTIVADGDFVMVHGRFSGMGLPVNWIVVDILRIEDSVLAEHWDVIQDEATKFESKSGLPMFDDKFTKELRLDSPPVPREGRLYGTWNYWSGRFRTGVRETGTEGRPHGKAKQ